MVVTNVRDLTEIYKLKKEAEKNSLLTKKNINIESTSIKENEKIICVDENSKQVLNIAKKEVDFDTDGHKLLIEAFFQNEDVFIFTITKYIESNISLKNKPKRYLTVKRKSIILNNSSYIYEFNSFEDFCEFCDFINKNNNLNIKGIYKTSILYFYNNTYYLIIDGINISNKSLNLFHSSLSEFSSPSTFTKNFRFKLKEHGKVIIRNNAIYTGIKYFS